MRRNILPMAIALSAMYMSIAACNGTPESGKEGTDANKDSVAAALADTTVNAGVPQVQAPKTDSVPYTIAENYFIRNTVKDTVPGKITTKADFDRYFGMAATMGKHGQPTPVDFARQYAIVVDLPDTKMNTDVRAISLIRHQADIIFSYKVSKGEKMHYAIRPFLMLIVDNQYSGNLILQKQ